MQSFSILIVDDEVNNFDVIEGILRSNKNVEYLLHYSPSAAETLSSLDIFQPDLILLDVMMPDMDGIELCKRIKAMPQWETVPIIMVTALVNKDDLLLCLSSGADDFVSKPVDRLELRARVQSMLRIRQQYLYIQEQKQKLENFNTQLEATVKERTAELHRMVFEYPITKLPTRMFLLQELRSLLETKQPQFALISLNCQEFQLINTSFGYAVGDQLLVAIAERLKQHINSGELLVHMKADEFCFLIPQMNDLASLELWLENMMKSFERHFVAGNYEIFISVCCGIAIGNDPTQKPEKFLQNAETAMYKAISQGKNCYQLFDDKMHKSILSRLTLENELQKALENQEFITYYQPIIDLQTKKIAGFEALVRWQHPQKGLIPPGVFIPSLETTGLIIFVGRVVLKQACQHLYKLHQAGYSNLTMSVNVSARQFDSSTLLTDIESVIKESKINPAFLKLEITESTLMENNTEKFVTLVKALRSRDIQISLDDFGTGYSSLSYLHRFPINFLKIDKSFVAHINQENYKHQILDTIVSLGHQLNMSIIAEGIETIEQLEWLEKLGCQFGQGYLFAKPLDSESALNFARENLEMGN